MTISKISIPAVVNTRGVQSGLQEAERDIAAFRGRVNRTAEGVSAAGLGSLGAGMRAGSGISGLAGLTGGAGTAAVGAFSVAAGVSAVVSLLQGIGDSQMRIRDAIEKGTSAADLWRSGINPVLASANAFNAPGTPGGFGSAFGQAFGANTRAPGNVASALRYAGGFYGSVWGQLASGKAPYLPMIGELLHAFGVETIDYDEAISQARLASSETLHEAILVARRDPRLRQYLAQAEAAARSQKRGP